MVKDVKAICHKHQIAIGGTEMRSRRGKLQLYGEILKQVKQGSKGKTGIMYQVNITWTRLNKHLNKLVALGLIKQQSSTFKVTDKGTLFLRHYCVIEILAGLE